MTDDNGCPLVFDPFIARGDIVPALSLQDGATYWVSRQSIGPDEDNKCRLVGTLARANSGNKMVTCRAIEDTDPTEYRTILCEIAKDPNPDDMRGAFVMMETAPQVPMVTCGDWVLPQFWEITAPCEITSIAGITRRLLFIDDRSPAGLRTVFDPWRTAVVEFVGGSPGLGCEYWTRTGIGDAFSPNLRFRISRFGQNSWLIRMFWDYGQSLSFADTFSDSGIGGDFVFWRVGKEFENDTNSFGRMNYLQSNVIQFEQPNVLDFSQITSWQGRYRTPNGSINVLVAPNVNLGFREHPGPASVFSDWRGDLPTLTVNCYPQIPGNPDTPLSSLVFRDSHLWARGPVGTLFWENTGGPGPEAPACRGFINYAC